MEEIQKKLREGMQEVMGRSEDLAAYFSPGRVNLIGEHTDYNGGHVFPCALTLGTYGLLAKREDDLCRLYSLNFPGAGVKTFSVGEDFSYDKGQGWVNYPKAVLKEYQKKLGSLSKGFDLVILGNLPASSGLSSSASLELLVARILSDLYGEVFDPIEAALLAQRAEREFVGVNCGIMDQFAIAMGKKEAAIYLDCDTLDYQYVPLALGDLALVIANSNKPRGLADSKYNERRASCEEAVADLQKAGLQINYLGELSSEEFQRWQSHIVSEEARKRAKHAVEENERTKKAVLALEKKDFKEFGELMKASHISLQKDYEVTGKELDCLVEAAWEQEGCLGSRMTGAGFGGCTVSLVKKEALENFVQRVGERYRDICSLEADFYIVDVGEGSRRLGD